MSEQNKALSRRITEECFNKGNLAVADEFVAANFTDHGAPPGLAPGAEGFKQLVAMYRNAFPDMRITIEDVIAEGDKVVMRWTARGTHKGDLMGIAPTGKTVTVTGIGIDRIANGKIVEHWESFDQMGMMQQLGVIPAR
ncbi:MAG: ester cyclase [candidate division KSB1 bacterium]|nr:ester cyclase [candidate division KSB1 bacterium]MDZ7364578.1 ester cyclase [candidate division KSB1 bacterium]MDZ7402674.1 ester cyclase [candidate division KSB1 bacterium]